MRCSITIQSSLPRTVVELRLTRLTSGSPFQSQNLTHVGGGQWTFTLQPVRPGLAIGFAKVAEMLVLVAREFDVDRVERLPNGTLAVAS